MMNSSSKASPTAAQQQHRKQSNNQPNHPIIIPQGVVASINIQQPLDGGRYQGDNWVQQPLPQKRQDVLELRQRIQNILLTDNQPGQGTTGNQINTGSNHHYQTYNGNPSHLSSGTTQQPMRLTPQPAQLAPTDDLGANRFSSMRPPSNQAHQLYQTAPSLKHAQNHYQTPSDGLNLAAKPPSDAGGLHRLLSEERTPSGNAGGEPQLSNRSKQFQGFQENLLMNRRGHQHHMLSGNGGSTHNQAANGGMGNSSGGQPSQLNKGMLSSQNQGVTTSESSKIMQRQPKGIEMGMIRSKKVLEIVQARQKGCQFCALNQSNSRSSPKVVSPMNSRLHPHHSLSVYHYLTHDALRVLVRETLDKKYLTSQDYYNSKIVSDIMYNENRHIVSVFKDYLIFDDFSEYLKRYYRDHEAFDRLPKVFEFYEKYSKVFPNYVALPAESKYMFKNIERKQKLIDEKHQQILERQEKQKQEQEEAKALGVALDSSVVQRMRMSKNVIFGSQFMNDLTDIKIYQNSQNNENGGDEVEGMLLRQQSSKKILDMLNVIQSQAQASYQPNSVMNQILKQQQQMSSSRQQQQTNQTNPSILTANGGTNLEALINQLHQFDARGDSLLFRTTDGRDLLPSALTTLPAPTLDLSLSSSHGMSSFLQDFDLTSGGLASQLPRDTAPFLANPTFLCEDDDDALPDPDEDDDFCMVVESTPLKQVLVTAGSRQSMLQNAQNESKRASTKTLNQQYNAGSRQSVQSNKNIEMMRVTPSSNGNNSQQMMIVANGKNTVQQKNSVHSKKGSIKQGNNAGQVMQMVERGNTLTKAQIPQQQQNPQQWSNMLLSSSGNSKKPDSVRKVGPSALLGSGSAAKNYSTQPQQQLTTPLQQPSSKITKQPTPKGGRLNPKNPQAPIQLTMSVSPQASLQPQIVVPIANNGPSQSRGAQRQSMHSADNQQSQVINGQNHQYVIQQQLSQSSFKSNGQVIVPQQLVVVHHPNVGRTSQVSIGSPLSQHSTQTGGVTKIGKNTIITKEMLQSMPAGSSLKQIATAAAKANLGQARQSITGLTDGGNSAAKKNLNASSRASAAGIQASTNQVQGKPNLQIPLQTHNHQHLLPRSGQSIKTESFTGVNQSTPSSLNGNINIPAHQLGSAGNSQSSMRISPDFSLVPNNHANILLMSGGTPGSGGSSFKKMNDPVSRSFKAHPQNATPQNISTKVNPNAISQSIRDAVSKLLPPQPKIVPGVSSSLQFTSGMNPLKSSMKHLEATSASPAAATAPPQSLQNNTAALFNKLFTGGPTQLTPTQPHGGTSNLRSSQQKPLLDNNQPYAPGTHLIQHFNPGYPTIHLEEDNHAQQLSAVYSTRVPQKKNFSSPDDLQLRIAARKNQHQQLAIATAQNTLQPLRKSANDFYDALASVSPQQASKKVLVVLKPKGNVKQGSPEGQQRQKKVKVESEGGSKGRMGSAEKQAEEAIKYMNMQMMYGGGAGSLGGDDLEEAALEEEEYLDELDERNDIYTAKGANQQHQQLHHTQVRQMASSATATTSTNTYNFKVNPHHQNSAQHNKGDSKRHPSMNSDKSHGSSVKSTNSNMQAQHPYQRVLTSFSTNTANHGAANTVNKKKVKVTPAQLEPTGSSHAAVGSKLYEKIRTGISTGTALHHAGTPQQLHSLKHQSNYNSNPNPVSAVGAATKKKPSTIFTFNHK